MVGDPHFSRGKYILKRLEDVCSLTVEDVQSHLKNTTGLWMLDCEHTHIHHKEKCNISDTPTCMRCGKEAKKFIDASEMIMHPNVRIGGVYRCKTHVHTHHSPCLRCYGCDVLNACYYHAIPDCSLQTSARCDAVTLTTEYTEKCSKMVGEHVFNFKAQDYHFCQIHKHRHTFTGNDCTFQTYKCCDKARPLMNISDSFVIKYKYGGKDCKRVIYSPQLWVAQSKNQFYALLKALVLGNSNIIGRFEEFEKSAFKVQNIYTYKSGKDSFVRNGISGYPTKGLFQTSTMDCTMMYDHVLIPQRLWDTLKEDFYTEYCLVKRDPSIKQTCMFVLYAEPNPDPLIETIVIPDALAVPLNQDQDGDKNIVYFIPKRVNGYEQTNTFYYNVAIEEMRRANKTLITNFGDPRISFSEYSTIALYGNEHLKMVLANDDFYKRYSHLPPKTMVEIGTAYEKDNFEIFYKKLCSLIGQTKPDILTVYDLMMQTKRLANIVDSGAKGSYNHIDKLMENLKTMPNTDAAIKDMKNLLVKYATSSHGLSTLGRQMFNMIYALLDLVVSLGIIRYNTVSIFDANDCGFLGCFAFNQGVYTAITEDFLAL